jgi:glyoxylase-like metal-dependent hydrolase (beta-lactamase superfamily II)
MHPLEVEKFGLDYDIPFEDGMSIPLGGGSLQAIHTPGHTPGMTSLRLDEERVVVGDTLFVGGPGRTWSAEEFATSMQTMQEIVFQWADATHFYPGHGPSGQIGVERSAFEAFVARGWAADLFGDVTWKKE